MRRARLPKAQPKILDGGRRTTQPKTPSSNAGMQSKSPSTTGSIILVQKDSIRESPSTKPHFEPVVDNQLIEKSEPDVVIEKTVENNSADHLSSAENDNDGKLLHPVLTVEDPPCIIEQSSVSSVTVDVTETVATKEMGEPSENKKEKRRYRYRHKLPEQPENMRLMDYIYFNPTSNQMPLKPKESREEVRVIVPTEEEEAVDNPDGKAADPEGNEEEQILPGPRVMIGPDGQITIDESSLVIERTRPEVDISQQEVVYETSDTTYKSFRKKPNVTHKFWTDRETAKFYKVLSVVGTDFTLMENIFPHKTRADLKNKYKKEERINRHLIDRALSEWQHFDLEGIEEYLKDPAEIFEKPKGKGRGRGAKRGRRPASVGDTDVANKTTNKKRKPAKKRHKNPIWDDSDEENIEEEEGEEEYESDSCEQCAIKTRTTKRQRVLGEKGLVRTCEHRHVTVRESIVDTPLSLASTLPNQSDGELSDVGQPKNAVENSSPISVTSTVANRSSDELTEGETTPVLEAKLDSVEATTTVKKSPSTNVLSVKALPLQTYSKTPTTVKVTPVKLPAVPTKSPTPSLEDKTQVPVPPAGTTVSSLLPVDSKLQSLVGVSPGQLVVVASKAPNTDQQVLHLYLVSPPNQSQSPSVDPQSTLRTLLSSPSVRMAAKPCDGGSTSKAVSLVTNSPGSLRREPENLELALDDLQVHDELKEAIEAADIVLFGNKKGLR